MIILIQIDNLIYDMIILTFGIKELKKNLIACNNPCEYRADRKSLN